MPMNMNDVMTEEKFKDLPKVNEAPVAVPLSDVMTEEKFNSLPMVSDVRYGVDFYNMEQALEKNDPMLLASESQLLQLQGYLNEEDGDALVMRVARKAAVAKYLARELKKDPDEVNEYFNQYSKEFFGSPVSVEDAWNRIREIKGYAGKKNLGERLAHDVGTGLENVGKGLADLGTAMVEGYSKVGFFNNKAAFGMLAYLADKFGQEDLASGIRNAERVTNEPLEKLVAYMREGGELARKNMRIRQQERGSAESFAEEVASGVITELPNFLVGIGIGAVSGGWGTMAYYGSTVFASEYADTYFDPNMSDAQKVVNAIACGSIEVVMEKFFKVPFLDKYFSKSGLPKELAEEFSKDILSGIFAAGKSFGIDFVREGFQEAMTGIQQRLVNALMNKGGADLRKMSFDDVMREIIQPAGQEFLVGGILAGGTGLSLLPQGYRHYKNMADAKQALHSAIEEGNTLARELAAKDNPTDVEVEALDLLHEGMDKQDPYYIAQAYAVLSAGTQQQQNVDEDGEAAADEFPEDMTMEDISDAALMEAKILRDKLKRTENAPVENDAVENSMRSIEDVKRDYAENTFTAVRTAAELPDRIQQQFARIPERQRKKVEAFYDAQEDQVYVIAENVLPSRVRKVVFHEVAVHKGLRVAMGDYFDSFIEKVGTDFAGEIEAWRSSEAGRNYAFASQQEAAEEFLAYLGEQIEGGNQSIMQKLVSVFRNFIRKIPKFGNLRFTQGEIEGMILASARKMQQASGRYDTESFLKGTAGIEEDAAYQSAAEKAKELGGKRVKNILDADISPQEKLDKLEKIVFKLSAGNYKDAMMNLTSILRQKVGQERFEKVKKTSPYRSVAENPVYYKSLEEAEQMQQNARSLGLELQFEENPEYDPEFRDGRFSIFGETGVSRMENATELIADLATAKVMLQEGKDAKNIKLATGWEKGEDGKWRMEFPDVKFTNKGTFSDGTVYQRTLWDIADTTYGKLADYVEAPEIFEAYPELKDVELVIADLPPGHYGSYIISQNRIEINRYPLKRILDRIQDETESYQPEQELIDTWKEDFFDYLNDTLAHEVQHAIQQIEGFAGGSNMDFFVDHPVRNPEYVKAAEDAIVKEYELQQKLGEHPDLFQDAHRFLYLEDHYFDDNVDEDAVDKELEEIEQKFRDVGQEELFKEFRNAVFDRKNAQRKVEKNTLSPTEAYTRTAGEVEARNVSDRAEMSMEERRQSLLNETADVAPEDRIYIEQLLDSSMNVRFSISPVWTGSAADYDKPSLHYIGTGEGAQAYGWGLYGSSDREVGEEYAKADARRKGRSQVLFDGKPYMEATENDIFARRILLRLDDGDTDSIDSLVKWYQYQIAEAEKAVADGDSSEQEYVDAFSKDLKWLLDNKDRISFIARKPEKGNRHLYNQTFFPDKEENLLDWDKPVPDQQMQMIADQGAKEGLPFVYSEDGKNVFNESNTSGMWVYEQLCKPYNGLGSPKAASEFLYRAGIDGITYIGDSSGVRNYVAFSDEDIRIDEHIRFSIRKDETAAEMADKLARHIMPVIRDKGATEAVEEEIRTILLEQGFDVDENQLQQIIKKAKDLVRGFQHRIELRKDLDYIHSVDPWINALAAQYGDTFRIVPGEKYRGEEFTGSWINNKKNAVGIPPDEAAQTIEAYTNEVVTDDDVIEHFRDLKRKDILKKRTEENRAYEAAMKTEELLHDQELARAILQGEEPLTEEFIKNYPRAAKMVRDTFPEAKDWNAVRAGLQNLDVESWQEGRRTGRGEYQKLLKDARKNHTDLKRVQELAIRYIKKTLPEEMQGAWLKRVADLAKYQTGASIAYPNGRREYELEKLFNDLQGYEVKERIIQLTDKYATKRNASGRPTAVLDEMQPVLENIRTSLHLSDAAVQYMIEKNQEKIQELENSGEEAQQLHDFNTVLDIFGALEHKSQEQLQHALNVLENIINGGIAGFRGRVQKRMEDLQNSRYRVIEEAGGGVIGPSRFEETSFFKKEGARHLSLRYLLDWISLKSGKDFEVSWGGEMWRKTEDADHAEQAKLRKMQLAWDKMLQDAGAVSMQEKRDFMQELNRKVEHTGVYKLQYTREREYGKGRIVAEDRRKWTMTRVSVSWARRMVAEHDGGAKAFYIDPTTGAEMAVPDYSVEFLRRQLAAYDAGADIMSEKFFGDPKDDAELQRFMQEQKEAEGEKQLVLIKYPKEETVRSQEVSLTKDSAMHVWLSWQQKDVRAGMEFNGWSENSILQIEEFLGPKYIRLAESMRAYIRKHRTELDAAAREDYGVGLPFNDQYFPVSYKGSLGKEMRADALLGAQYGEMSMAPSFLIARKFHLNDVDTDSSAVSAFLGNQIEQAHYLAWRKVIREFKGVLNDRGVREAVTKHYGREVFDQLVDRVDVIAKGGRSTSAAVQEIAKFYKFWVPAKIALNMSSVAKQLAGAVNYMNDIPAGAFFRGYADSFVDSELRDRFFDEVINSDWFKNRQGGSLDKDLVFMLNSTRNIQNYNPTTTWLLDKMTLPTRWADAKSVLHGGFAVFKYHYENTLKMLEKEHTVPEFEDKIDAGPELDSEKNDRDIQRIAWDEAWRKFIRSSEETQQSGALKDQNFYQSQAGMFRYLTTFMTNPLQILNKELQMINRLQHASGARLQEAKRDAARMIVINHIVMPVLMEGITQFFRNGGDWDEYDFWDFLTGMILGPFEAWLVAGKAVRAFANTLQREPSFGSVFQALPVIDDALNGVAQIIRFARLDEAEGDDWLKLTKATADLAMLAGSAHPAAAIVSAIGSGISAGLREARRSIKLFNSFTKED